MKRAEFEGYTLVLDIAAELTSVFQMPLRDILRAACQAGPMADVSNTGRRRPAVFIKVTVATLVNLELIMTTINRIPTTANNSSKQELTGCYQIPIINDIRNQYQ
jgi:hypothetical protein